MLIWDFLVEEVISCEEFEIQLQVSYTPPICCSFDGDERPAKETFSPKDRNQLLKMATFGPTAEMVLDLNNSNANNDVADEVEWLDYQA